MKECVLYDRECIGCLECETCDLDENKVCDNCGKCIDFNDVASIKIDKVYTNPDEYKENWKYKRNAEPLKVPRFFYSKSVLQIK